MAEETLRWIAVAEAGQLSTGRPLRVETEGRGVVLVKLEDGSVHALEDLCSHDDAVLSEGCVKDGQIECARHGARFDLKTGAATAMPAITPVRTYPARVNGKAVEIGVE